MLNVLSRLSRFPLLAIQTLNTCMGMYFVMEFVVGFVKFFFHHFYQYINLPCA